MCFTLSTSFIPQHSRRLYFVQGQDLGKSRYDTGTATIFELLANSQEESIHPQPLFKQPNPGISRKGYNCQLCFSKAKNLQQLSLELGYRLRTSARNVCLLVQHLDSSSDFQSS